MLHKFHLLGDIPREILETSSLWLPYGTMPRSGSSGRLPFSFAFKVWFKRIVGDATLGQVSLFLSCLSLLSTVLLWPLIVIFHYTRWEEYTLGGIQMGRYPLEISLWKCSSGNDIQLPDKLWHRFYVPLVHLSWHSSRYSYQCCDRLSLSRSSVWQL